MFFVFTVLEIFLFFKLTAEPLKPIKWFMGFLVCQNVLLSFLLSPARLYQYFMCYWYTEMICLVWFAYISGRLVGLLVPKTPNLLQLLPPTVTGIACLINLPPKYTVPLLRLQTVSLSMCIFIILTAIFFKVTRLYLSTAKAVISMLLVAELTIFAWRYLGYQPMMWELSWSAVLIVVLLSLKTQQQQLLASEHRL